jgi:lipopolysaccharide transport protein LptA
MPRTCSSKNSRWTFTGRVTITSEQRGSLWADQAILVYRDGALDRILATGAPARFEQRRTDSGRADHGQADEITYEAKPATVRLRGHPQISAGSGLEMSAPMFLYHVRDGRLQAYSDNGTPAVHIVTKPTDALVPWRCRLGSRHGGDHHRSLVTSRSHSLVNGCLELCAAARRLGVHHLVCRPAMR